MGNVIGGVVLEEMFRSFLEQNIQLECHVEVASRCEVGCMYLKFRGEDAITVRDINLEVVM